MTGEKYEFLERTAPYRHAKVSYDLARKGEEQLASIHPVTIARPVHEQRFGHHLVDPYRWLEQGASAEVQEWAEKQHTYTVGELRDNSRWEPIRDRLRQLRNVRDITVPKVAGDSQVFLLRDPEQNQAVLCLETAGQRITVYDPNQSPEPEAVDWFELSHQGQYIAFGVSQHGNEWSTLHVFDTIRGKLTEDRIPRARYSSVAFDPEGTGFYYTRYPLLGEVSEEESDYHSSVFWHTFREPYTKDPMIFHDADRRSMPSINISGTGRYLAIQVSHGWVEDEVLIKDRMGDAPWQKVGPTTPGIAVPYWVQDRLFLHTNRKSARWELLEVDLSDGSWRSVIPPDEGNVLHDVGFFQHRIIAHYNEIAVSRLETFSLDGTSLGAIGIPHYSQVTGMAGSWDGDLTIFGLTGFDRPHGLYRWQAEESLLTPLNVIPDLPSAVSVSQEWATSRDGTRVPYFLLTPKGLVKTGSSPAVVTGYGGFNIAYMPAYSPSILHWVEEGGIYVVSNLRGGSEFGETWHQAGMLDRKQNVFDDFAAVIEDLQHQGWTDPDHTVITGRSNGGLLVGALLTQRPELMKGVVCGVPLLDMIRYPYFQIADLWTHEYGSPDKAADFEWLLKYSPYHNVRPTIDYPATLFFTSSEDSRVDPLHARKMTALLQNLPGQTHPIYLRIESQAGHGVGKTVEQWVTEEADIWTFTEQLIKSTPSIDFSQ